MKELLELLEKHRLAVFSWGPDGCKCGWDGDSQEHPQHLADELLLSGLLR